MARWMLTTWGTMLSLLVLVLALHGLSPVFLTAGNLQNVLLQSSINAVIAVGMTLVIISGGIDLSVGSVLALAGIVLGGLLKDGTGLIPALLAAVAIGGACGLVNGALISLAKLPPFIASLGTMSIARGLALVISDGRPYTGFDETFKALAGGEILGLPVPIILMVLLVGFAHFMLTMTRFGRYLYAIGGNAEAAWLSGIGVKRVITAAYVACGATAGLGGAILTSRLNSAQPIAGVMYELDAIAATVIGGTSLMGGSGGVLGTLIGALMMGVLRNGLNLLNISSFVQQIVIGVVIIAAVLIDRLKQRWLLAAAAKRTKERSRGRGFALTLFILAFFLLAVGGISWMRSGAEGGTQKKETRIGFIFKTLNNPFFIKMKDAASSRAGELGIELVMQAPERETDVEKQVQMVENMVEMHLSAILLTPSGSKELVRSILKANQAGIPVIIVDSRIDAELATREGASIATFIGSDNIEGGRIAGRFLAEQLQGKGDLVLLEGIPGHETVDSRKRGFLEAVSAFPQLRVVASQPADAERGKAFDVFQNLMQAHQGIRGVFAANDLMALGALEALKASHYPEKVLLVGFDATKDALESIAKGELAGSVAQYPEEMGRVAVETAAKILAGEKVASEIPTKVELMKAQAP